MFSMKSQQTASIAQNHNFYNCRWQTATGRWQMSIVVMVMCIIASIRDLLSSIGNALASSAKQIMKPVAVKTRVRAHEAATSFFVRFFVIVVTRCLQRRCCFRLTPFAHSFSSLPRCFGPPSQKNHFSDGIFNASVRLAENYQTIHKCSDRDQRLSLTLCAQRIAPV